MQITRQADYAVRAVYYLTLLGSDGRAATSKIAKKQHIPASFLAKIVSQLSVAGLLKTSRGARGGVSLARQPKSMIPPMHKPAPISAWIIVIFAKRGD